MRVASNFPSHGIFVCSLLILSLFASVFFRLHSALLSFSLNSSACKFSHLANSLSSLLFLFLLLIKALYIYIIHFDNFMSNICVFGMDVYLFLLVFIFNFFFIVSSFFLFELLTYFIIICFLICLRFRHCYIKLLQLTISIFCTNVWYQ